jgi:hypothetical protein
VLRPTWEHLLRQPDAPAALILDGLDESFYLTRRGGLQILLNLLRDVKVPVVLTARTEFFRARQADFTTLFGLTGAGPGRRRRIRLVELLPWDDAQIALLARRYHDSLADPDEQQRLRRLITSIEQGAYRSFYGNIPRRPLFLRLILETVACHDVHRVGRARLFAEWARLKVVRDALSGRAPILDEAESGDTTCGWPSGSWSEPPPA